MTACELCKGACCETFILELKLVNSDFYTWLAYHGKATESGVMFDAPCKHLTDGRCGIYEDRPNICRVYVVGNEHCLRAIEERRYGLRHQIRDLIDGKESKGTS
jgi:Fe-S-cluster containining protein